MVNFLDLIFEPVGFILSLFPLLDFAGWLKSLFKNALFRFRSNSFSGRSGGFLTSYIIALLCHEGGGGGTPFCVLCKSRGEI